MNMNFLKIGLMGLGAALLLSACGRCGHHSDRFEKMSGKVAKKVASKLKLDEGQKAKLEAVRATLLEKHAEMKSKRADHLSEVLGLIRSESFDKSKASALADEHHKSMQGVKDKLIGQIAEFHASLSPGQREELAKMLDKHASCHVPKK